MNPFAAPLTGVPVFLAAVCIFGAMAKAKLSPYRAKGAAPFYVAKSAFPRSKARDLMGNGDWGFIGTPIPLPTEA